MYLVIKKTKSKLLYTLLFVFNFFNTTLVSAEGYIPLEPLTESAASGVTLSTYLADLFKIGIGLAGVFAVLMIVIGGISYIGGASNPSARSEAKSKITNAIFGLILAMASWLILNTINPDLLKTGLIIEEVSTQEVEESWFFNWRYTSDPDEFIRSESGPFSSIDECVTQKSNIGTEIIPYNCISR